MQAMPPSDSGAPADGAPEVWPFATLVAVSVDDRGRPLLLLSRLAEHTKNLEGCPRASLLLTDPAGSGDADEPADPLAAGRVTLVGACAVVPAIEREAAQGAFLAAHPGSAQTMGFADFALWRVDVARVRWIGGFGRMGWVDASDYFAASAGPGRL
jgi:putative heme iron utilization protein